MNAEQMILLSQKLVMLSLANDQADRERLTKEIAALNAELTEGAESNEKTVYCRPLKFSDKEISKMPKTFRKEFRVDGCTAHVRKRCDGRYRCSYEIRYRRNGYNVTASATTLTEAKQKFIAKLHQVEKQKQSGENVTTTGRLPTRFNEFALYWFENFHKRKVVEKTHDNNLGIYRRHIAEKLGKYPIARIYPNDLQELLENLPGNGKTADDVYTILNQIFDCAVKHGLITLNPLGMCFHEKHEPENGVALTIEEERLLLDTFANTEYQLYFAIILYTGLRPNEYPTAVLEGQFIKAVKSKRHGKKKKIEYKYIPITPMLRPYMENVTSISLPRAHIIEHRFKKVFPDHTLKDMRMTFQTRCDQCKIPDNVIGAFMGNSIGGNLKKTYTDLQNADYMQYLYTEGQKLSY